MRVRSKELEKRTSTYGLSAQADYRAKDPTVEGLTTKFNLLRRGEDLGEVRVRMPGIHNVLNTLAVIAVASAACSDASPSSATPRSGTPGASRSSTTTGTTRPRCR